MFELLGDKNSLVKVAIWMGMGAGVVLVLAMLMGGVFTADVKASTLSDRIDECIAHYEVCSGEAIDDMIDCELGGVVHPPGFCEGVLDYGTRTCEVALDECLYEVEEWLYGPTPSPSDMV